MMTTMSAVCPFCTSSLSSLPIESDRWRFFRCSGCGYWTSRTTQNRFPEMEYNDTPTFDLSPGHDWDKIVSQAVPILAKKFQLAGKRGGRFLDIGCSEGVYLAASAKLGWQAVGLDVDRAKLIRAKARGLDVRSVDVCDPAAVLTEFDFVLLRHVIEHIPDFLALSRSAARFLASDGVMCIECPNHVGVAALLSRRRLKDSRFLGNLYPPTHIHAFEPTTFRKLATSLDMKCINVLTYSQSDPNWFLPSHYSGARLKAAAQRLTAQMGRGGNIAAFYVRNGCSGN